MYIITRSKPVKTEVGFHTLPASSASTTCGQNIQKDKATKFLYNNNFLSYCTILAPSLYRLVYTLLPRGITNCRHNPWKSKVVLSLQRSWWERRENEDSFFSKFHGFRMGCWRKDARKVRPFVRHFTATVGICQVARTCIRAIPWPVLRHILG